MTELVLGRSAPEVLLSHLALYGVAGILEEAGLAPRLCWSPGGNPRPVLTVEADHTTIGQAVHAHAVVHAEASSWIHQDVPDAPGRGLMSPRLSVIGQRAWPGFQRARHSVLNQLTDEGRWLDLRLLGCLGEPSYWSYNAQGELTQDHGANRLEMQPRNRGSEFVGTRLRKLAEAVAARDTVAVLEGLTGASVRDESERGKPDSRSATGLAGPGPTDNALAWCAMWGISFFPIAMRVSTQWIAPPAVCTGNVRGRRREHEWFYAPMWSRPWSPARLRTVLASKALRLIAATGVSDATSANPSGEMQADAMQADAWLAARGVDGIIRFPVGRFGSDNAPERRAMRGEPIPVGGRRE